MKRVALLAVLAIALPTAAFANSIDYTGITPANFSGSFSTSLGANFTLGCVNGNCTGITGNISFSTGSLTSMSCPLGFSGSCYSFSGGNLSVTGSALFSDSFTGGFVNKNGSTLTIAANLTPNGNVVSGSGTVTLQFTTGRNGYTVNSGSADVSYTAVPEPGTLGLLGTGLIGLAGMVRRKLRS